MEESCKYIAADYDIEDNHYIMKMEGSKWTVKEEEVAPHLYSEDVDIEDNHYIMQMEGYKWIVKEEEVVAPHLYSEDADIDDNHCIKKTENLKCIPIEEEDPRLHTVEGSPPYCSSDEDLQPVKDDNNVQYRRMAEAGTYIAMDDNDDDNHCTIEMDDSQCIGKRKEVPLQLYAVEISPQYCFQDEALQCSSLTSGGNVECTISWKNLLSHTEAEFPHFGALREFQTDSGCLGVLGEGEISKRCGSCGYVSSLTYLGSYTCHFHEYRCPSVPRTWNAHFCHICGEELQVQRRMLVRDGNLVPFACGYCYVTYITPERLANHLLMHSKRPYKCNFCQYRSTQHETLLHHVLKNHWGVKRSCKICGKFFELKKKLRSHMLSSHAKMKDYLCEICGEVFRYKTDFLAHMKYHLGSKSHQCDVCRIAFFKRDLSKCGLSDSVSDSVVENACLCCGQLFENINHMKAHLKWTHNVSKIFVCKTCGKRFIKQSLLKTHIYVMHGSKKIDNLCKACERLLSSKLHFQTHKNNSEKQCEKCGKYMHRTKKRANGGSLNSGETEVCSSCRPNDTRFPVSPHARCTIRKQKQKGHKSYNSDNRNHETRLRESSSLNGEDVNSYRVKVTESNVSTHLFKSSSSSSSSSLSSSSLLLLSICQGNEDQFPSMDSMTTASLTVCKPQPSIDMTTASLTVCKPQPSIDMTTASLTVYKPQKRKKIILANLKSLSHLG